MSEKFDRKLELAANLAIVVVVLAIVGVLGYKFFSVASPPDPPEFVEVQAGENLELPGIDWAQNKQTLIVAISSDCSFCVESAPFYDRLIKKLSESNSTKLVAVFPHSVEQGRAFLKEHSLEIAQVMRVDLASARILGTPNIYLADERGVIKNAWPGKLPTEKEAEVLSKL